MSEAITKKEKTPIRARAARAPRGSKRIEQVTAPHKLKLLFTIVNRQKAELYADLLQAYDVNMQMFLSAQGTASTEMLQYLGLGDDEKVVIASIIREDLAADALHMLEEKFRTIKNGKGIAYTVPMSGTIGVAVYQFLCNHRGDRV
ncbi:MAG: hypothetical protein IJY20_08745 [Clostridia bacterium]|nr:hypothetical protein [Clostridia bacterium]